MKKFGSGKQIAWGLLLVAALATPALSKIQVGNISNVFLTGVDFYGSPYDYNGGYGPGKVYKDTYTQILVTTASASVYNDYGYATVFKGLGYYIYDPFSYLYQYTTASTIRYSRPTSGISTARSLAVYVP